jgi:hypothetical protein
MDFGIFHFYSSGGTSGVLNSTDDLPGIFDNIRNRLDTYAYPGASNDIEIHMTEFGYFGSVANPQIDGIYAANTYATALADGIRSVHWLELSKDSFIGDNQNNQGLIRGGAFYGMQLFSHIAPAGAEFVETTSSNGSVEVHSLVLPDGRAGMLLANLNSSGTATVNVNISGMDLDVSGTQWLYGQNQTTPLETPMAAGLGNSFSVNVPFRSIVALLIDAEPTLDGDFNSDGVVDAADYVVWRKGLAGTGSYEVWRQYVGNIQAPGGGASVPEPATAVLVVIAVTALLTTIRAGRTYDNPDTSPRLLSGERLDQ